MESQCLVLIVRESAHSRLLSLPSISFGGIPVYATCCDSLADPCPIMYIVSLSKDVRRLEWMPSSSGRSNIHLWIDNLDSHVEVYEVCFEVYWTRNVTGSQREFFAESGVNLLNHSDVLHMSAEPATSSPVGYNMPHRAPCRLYFMTAEEEEIHNVHTARRGIYAIA